MPLKSSQPVGAALAFLGINRAIPMLHGSQGCTAFAKVFFVRHFREPIPLQTTAMDQASSVMGADENVIEGLITICEKSKPALIGVPTTGLSETQGCDVMGAVREFRKRYPQFAAIKVVPVNTPDFTGSMETGYGAAVLALIDVLVLPREEANTQPGRRPKQVNILAGSFLTPGDLEALKELVEMFGLRPLMVPDLSDSLDGHMGDDDFSPLTIGGTLVSEFATLGDAVATLVVGASLNAAADLLHARTAVHDYRFAGLMGLAAMDELMLALSEISGQPVPEKLERQRSQLEDAMVDTHFMLGQARIGIAADPDLLAAFAIFLTGMGAEMVATVSSTNAEVLNELPVNDIKIGDLEDLEQLAKLHKAELIIGNSHCSNCAEHLQLPLLHAGFPLYDLIGGYQRTWIGYRSSRQTLFDLANMLLAHNQHEIKPYRSIYSTRIEDIEARNDSSVTTAARGVQ